MATYINGLCLPTVMLSTGMPYNVTTIEQLTADIATLNTILDNTCVTPEPPLVGLRLTWNDVTNSPFASYTDLNAFINGNGGTANYTAAINVGNAQIFSGGTNVDLGDFFMDGNPNIISIEDEAFQVVAQGRNGQRDCEILETIALPALVTQGEHCQNSNTSLTGLNLQSLTTQTSDCQSNNDSIISILLPALTTQTSNNQSGNLLLTSVSLSVLGTQDSNNQSNNAALVTLTLPALTTQTSGNQSDNTAFVSLTLPALTTQTDSNQANNPISTKITTPLLTSIGTGNYVGCNYAIMIINVDASLFGAADILAAQAGGATII